MLDRTINLKLKVYDVAGFLLEVNLVLSGNLGIIFCRLTIHLIATYIYSLTKKIIDFISIMFYTIFLLSFEKLVLFQGKFVEK